MRVRRHRKSQHHRERSFASAEHAMKKKRTRRERFLADMERVVPWGLTFDMARLVSGTSCEPKALPEAAPRCAMRWHELVRRRSKRTDLGQVNRLKFLKLRMYGRANLDLLRIRTLHHN
jgi:hypothetical protein